MQALINNKKEVLVQKLGFFFPHFFFSDSKCFLKIRVSRIQGLPQDFRFLRITTAESEVAAALTVLTDDKLSLQRKEGQLQSK